MRLPWKKFLLPATLLFLLLYFPLAVFAQNNSSSKQNTVTFDRDQVINHDYFAAGDMVILDGTVNGDAYIAGGQTEINGNINGDLLAVSGQITVRGKVSQNIRALGGNVLIEGEVGRNVSVAGGNLTIDKSAKIGGNAAIAGGNIELLSPVKDLALAGGNARIASDVSGSVTAGVGTLALSQNSIIHGNLEYWSKNEAVLSSGAKVLGKTTFHPATEQTNLRESQEKVKKFISGAGIFFSIISFISSLILGILFITLLPVFSKKTADVISSKFWLTLLVGFLTFILAPVIAVILLITLIGLPYALIILFAFGVLLYISKLFVVLAAGIYLSEKANWHLSPIWSLVLGLILYYLLGFIPIVGFLMKTIVVLCGLGALIMQKKYYFVTLRDKKLI